MNREKSRELIPQKTKTLNSYKVRCAVFFVSHKPLDLEQRISLATDSGPHPVHCGLNQYFSNFRPVFRGLPEPDR